MILNDEIFNSKGNTSYVFISPIYFALLRFSKKKKRYLSFSNSRNNFNRFKNSSKRFYLIDPIDEIIIVTMISRRTELIYGVVINLGIFMVAFIHRFHDST